MTGRWGTAHVVAVLRIVPAQPGRNRAYPTADYWCICGHRAEASGDQVREFVRTAATQHEATCPRGEVAQ